MRQLINTTFHGIGYMFICIGFIICIGAAGNSDLGVDLSEVFRLAMAGVAACVGGLFLTRWTV